MNVNQIFGEIMPIQDSVIEAIRKDEKLMRAYEKQIMKASARYRREIRRALERVIADLMIDDAGNVMPTPINRMILDFSTSEANRILGAGYEEMIDEIKKTFQKRLRTINRLVVNLGIEEGKLTDVLNNPNINMRIEEAFARIARGKTEIGYMLQRKARELREGIGDGRKSRTALKKALESKAGISSSYSATVMRTELGGVDRDARVFQAREADIETMLYTGPMDALTRPYCAEHVNMVKPIHYWENVSANGQIEPPLIYGGGYNCRHRLIPFRPEWRS